MHIENFEKLISVEDYLKDFVDLDKTMAACRKCPVFGKSWSCPPFDADIDAFWHSYGSMKLFCRKITFDDDDYEEGLDFQKFFYDTRDVLEVEMAKREEEEPGSTSFIGGTCTLCGLGHCARKDGGPCRYPTYMRHTIEALGGDVEKTLREFFGIKVEWPKDGKLPFMVFVTALLRPKKAGDAPHKNLYLAAHPDQK